MIRIHEESLIKFQRRLWTNIIQTKEMPQQFQECQAVWIPKPNKDPKVIKNLRPINLIRPLAKTLFNYIERRTSDFEGRKRKTKTGNR